MRFHPRVLSVAAATLMVITSQAQAVVVGDYNWRQLSETTGISYQDISGTCNALTGTCSGMLGSVDFSDWIWAGTAEVGELFAALTGAPAGTFASTVEYRETGSSWAPAAIDTDGLGTGSDTGLFQRTFLGTVGSMIQGISRDLANVSGSLIYAPWLQDRSANGEDDSAATNQYLLSTIRSNSTGVWLYQSAASISAPSTSFLMLAGGVGLGLCRRRAFSTINPRRK